MKIKFEIEADPEDFETILRMVLMGQISETDITRAKQREELYKSAERNARVSQLFLEACEKQQKD